MEAFESRSQGPLVANSYGLFVMVVIFVDGLVSLYLPIFVSGRGAIRILVFNHPSLGLLLSGSALPLSLDDCIGLADLLMMIIIECRMAVE